MMSWVAKMFHPFSPYHTHSFSLWNDHFNILHSPKGKCIGSYLKFMYRATSVGTLRILCWICYFLYSFSTTFQPGQLIRILEELSISYFYVKYIRNLFLCYLWWMTKIFLWGLFLHLTSKPTFITRQHILSVISESAEPILRVDFQEIIVACQVVF